MCMSCQAGRYKSQYINKFTCGLVEKNHMTTDR